MRQSRSVVLIGQLLAICCLMGLSGAQQNGKCPAGWLNRPNSNWCYQLSDNMANYKTWTDAKKACELQHASLLSIADEEERVWLAERINPYIAGDRFWWFGLSRFGGSWMWDDGHTGNEQPESLGKKALLYWWSGVNDGTSGNCMAIYQDLQSKQFIRVWPRDCELKSKYVCKKLKPAKVPG